MSRLSFEFHPLTLERWGAFESLFGRRGGCGGCWCMWWRQSSREFEQCKGETNRRKMKELVDGGAVPGVLAFDGPRAVGWCSVAPRDEFPRLDRSRTMKRIDDEPVWSIVCLYVDKAYRKQGLSVELVRAAAEYAAERGARIVEAYPRVPAAEESPDVFIYTGLPKFFERVGFETVARPSAKRWIMRKHIADKQR